MKYDALNQFAFRRRSRIAQNDNKPSITMETFFGTVGSPIKMSKLEPAKYDEPMHSPVHSNRTYQRNSLPDIYSTDLLKKGENLALGEENADDIPTIRNPQRQQEAKRSPKFIGKPAKPLEQLKLDGAKMAQIPRFISPWFHEGDKEGRIKPKIKEPRPQLVHAHSPLAHSENIPVSDLELGRVIGQGAFGKVHEGRWRGRAVAIKVLICQDLRHDIMKELESEVRIMSVLRHPNICRLLGACMDPQHRALVVELSQRGSLWSVLRNSRRSLTLDMRTRFLYDTAKGMSYLHHFERPILHRDLKSPNLLVDANYTIKLSDFGLARVKAHVQTMTGNCGTVQWMAPEVLGHQKYTEKADVFSFAIVIWEVMTGRCPYDGMSQIHVALGVLNRNLRPSIPRDCPPFFARLMKSCWNRQPELRPSFPHIVSAFRSYQSKLMHQDVRLHLKNTA
uniref:non-specific serine/threonine protein kinase n=1 Tax=Albugo laibachii Nc14 TaxID=890382 RepID=F0WPQ9_9STRA|nr:protein kinase putative [Albugo laibachii Nc14]CCA24354.1 protein kinase putative [Albugo laibachii Nc14]|eukprot:CCA24354.1 protein kinase putative [Albugo laibachii Nc14]